MPTKLNQIEEMHPEDASVSSDEIVNEPAGVAERIPLSFGQERLWFLQELDPANPAYHVPLALRLRGSLDVDRLRAALERIVLRHEVLRTVYRCENGRVFQEVQDAFPMELNPVALRGIGAIAPWIRAEARQAFDLVRGPVIRVRLGRLKTDDHVLLVVVHHIASDEWSLRVFLEELVRLYADLDAALPELPIQYADYAVWQREWFDGERMERQLKFWRDRLSGELPRLQLPMDSPGSGDETAEGLVAARILDSGLVESLESLARKEGATLYVLLMAGLKALLFRYTGGTDLLVGTPVSGRTRVETEPLIGFFVNTVVVRSDVTGALPFLQLLRGVRERAFEAFAGQDVPFERLVAMVRPERGIGQVPLIQVMFAMEEMGAHAIEMAGLEAEWIEMHTGTAKFDWTVAAKRAASGLTLTVEYNSRCFHPETMERMLAHYETLLRAVAVDPTRSVADLPLLTPDEEHRAVRGWNQTARSYPRDATLAELFEAQAAMRPEATAVIYDEIGGSDISARRPRRFTYGELNLRANQLAHRLRALGVGAEAKVGLCIARSVEMVIGMVGIIKAGGAYVPLDPSYPAERISYMTGDAGADVIVTEKSLAARFAGEEAQVICIDELDSELPEKNPVRVNRAGDAAYVIYTSGSTGRPKGVLVPQRAVVRLVCGTDYVQIEPGDRVAQVSNASFDAATFEIWGPLLNGGCIVGLAQDITLSPKDLTSQLRAYQVRTLFLTTALFNQIAREMPDAFASLRDLLFGGEAVDPKWVRRVLQEHPPKRLLHVYGPTETTTFATWFKIDRVAENATTIPIGRPIANTEVYVLDSAMHPVPVGVQGEIYIGGEGVARGYCNQPELTAERFVPDPFSGRPDARLYRTGDLARYRSDGSIEFIGRKDQQVKIRGFRVEPGEIESVLMSHPAVREAVVLPHREAASGTFRLVAYLVFKEDGLREHGRAGGELVNGQFRRSAARSTSGAEWGSSQGEFPILSDPGEQMDAVRALAKQKLPDYMVPSAFVPLRSLPLTPNGKIDRAVLPLPDAAPRQDRQLPRDSVEEALTRIWQQLLGVQELGVTDDFFDLGGHSLLAIRLFAEVEKQFGRKLPLSTLFQAPTIELLAAVIRDRGVPRSRSLIVGIQPGGSKRPIFWIHSLGGDGGGAFFYYRKLAELLGPDQPSFGIRSPEEPFVRLETMAAHYIDQLLAFQPEGPYYLGGFCFGGNVAFEMARQLALSGRQVGLLILLESAVPRLHDGICQAVSAPAFFGHLQEWLRELVQQSPDELLRRLRRKQQALIRRVSRSLAFGGKSNASVVLQDLMDMSAYPADYVRFAQAHWEALSHYDPQPYPGRVLLFRSRKQPLSRFDPTLGWGSLAQDGVAVNVIPGSHEKLLEEPNVHILAVELKACLAEAEAASAEKLASCREMS